jgi:hypothetical protein
MQFPVFSSLFAYILIVKKDEQRFVIRETLPKQQDFHACTQYKHGPSSIGPCFDIGNSVCDGYRHSGQRFRKFCPPLFD